MKFICECEVSRSMVLYAFSLREGLLYEISFIYVPFAALTFNAPGWTNRESTLTGRVYSGALHRCAPISNSTRSLPLCLSLLLLGPALSEYDVDPRERHNKMTGNLFALQCRRLKAHPCCILRQYFPNLHKFSLSPNSMRIPVRECFFLTSLRMYRDFLFMTIITFAFS